MRTPPGRRRARPFHRQEGERKEDRDPTEEMVSALSEPVGGDCEREPAHEGRHEAELERAQPGVGQDASGDHCAEEQQVPCEHGPKEGLERPKGEAERPTAQRDLRLHQRLKAERIPPRGVGGCELVAEEPEAVDDLAVISRSRLSVSFGAAGEVGRPERGEARPGGDQCDCRIEERYEAERAEARSSSKSGSSPTSYRHAAMIMPSSSSRKADRSATRSRPR